MKRKLVRLFFGLSAIYLLSRLLDPHLIHLPPPPDSLSLSSPLGTRQNPPSLLLRARRRLKTGHSFPRINCPHLFSSIPDFSPSTRLSKTPSLRAIITDIFRSRIATAATPSFRQTLLVWKCPTTTMPRGQHQAASRLGNNHRLRRDQVQARP